VGIADTVTDFAAAVEEALLEQREPRVAKVDEFLGHMSWHKTWAGMKELVDAAVSRNRTTLHVDRQKMPTQDEPKHDTGLDQRLIL
jgi:hypothetical protein